MTVVDQYWKMKHESKSVSEAKKSLKRKLSFSDFKIDGELREQVRKKVNAAITEESGIQRKQDRRLKI